MKAEVNGLIKSSIKSDQAFTRIGFQTWRKGKSSFEKHQKSDRHKSAIIKLEGLSRTNIGNILIESKSKDQRESRTALMAIITSIRYLARQGLAIRGHEEFEGNFIQLLQLRASEVPELKQWLVRSKPLTSHDVQNEILQLFAHSILRKVVKEIRSCREFSIMADETTDSACKEQVCFFVRYVINLTPKEAFLGMYETSSTTGLVLTNILLDVFQRYGLDIQFLRGQCYDGASNMKGQDKGVQARVLELQPLACYTHCFNHSLNLALQDATKTVSLLRDALNVVNELGVFVKGSPKRLSQFRTLADTSNTSTPKPLCPTRWCVRIKSIDAIMDNYKTCILLLNEIAAENTDSSPKAKDLLS